MRQLVFLVSFLCASVLSIQVRSQEEGFKISLTRCLDDLAASRAGIKTFEVRMNGVKMVRGSRTTVGKETIDAIASVQVEVAGDLLQHRWLLLSQTEPVLPNLAYRPAQVSADVRAYLIQGTSAFMLGQDGFVELQDAASIHIPDPLALGCGFCLESTRFVPFASAVANLRSWQKLPFFVERNGPMVTFRNQTGKDHSKYDTLIAFDSMRGGMVRTIEQRLPQGGQSIRGDVEPVLVDGHWVPKRVAYTCGSGGFFTWELDWISVNKPLPDDLFDQEVVLQLLGR